MLSIIAVSLLVSPQNAPAAPAVPTACSVLQPQEVASIIGAAKPMTVTNSATGSSCMFQNGNKIITVLLVNRDSNESAKGQWDVTRMASAGKDVAGWTTPAYSAVIDTPKDHVAIVGIVKNRTFVEAKVLDVSQKSADLSAKLLAVMKALSGRL